MTKIADVIQKAMVVIDDVRLIQQLAENPAVFYHKMCDYVNLTIPMLSSPPELYDYIMKGYEEPLFDSFSWESTDESLTEETEVDTGKTGYELCCVSVYNRESKTFKPYKKAKYAPETGVVTFPIQVEQDIIYEIDFYKDGAFNELSPQMMRLFSLGIAVMWNERLDNDWLSVHPKIQDSSFKTVNEANYVDKMTIRTREKRREFTDELKKFEQIAAYQKAVRHKTIFQ